MAKITSLSSAALAAVILMCWSPSDHSVAAQAQRVNLDAQLQADFKKRVAAYMEMRNRFEKQSPMKKTDNPAEIRASQDALAAAIRAARSGAQQGDIFTPPIADVLKKLMSPEVKGKEGAETKKAIKDEGPAALALKVNARYPETAALPTVPPNLLASLPQLPEHLEYRVVGRDLILRDVQANLIVDFIPKAIP